MSDTTPALDVDEHGIGIIFDLDGVITETSEQHEDAWRELARSEGLPFDLDPDDLRGVSRRDSALLLLGDQVVNEDELQRLMTTKNDVYVASLSSLTPRDALPGAVDLLADARRRGCRLAIGSSSRNAGTVLAALRLTDAFDAIADGYSVTNAKPAPDLFLHAAELLGLPPERCVVVEDASSGVDAALAAGMVAVGVGPADRVGHATHRFDSVAAIDLDVVLADLLAGSTLLDNGLVLRDGWSFERNGHHPEDVITAGSNWLTGNGRVGCRGTFAEWARDGFVGCIVADTYDTADGKWRELVNAPNALHTRWTLDGDLVGLEVDEVAEGQAGLHLLQRFDLRIGRMTRRVGRELGGTNVVLTEHRFASMSRTHLVVQRHVVEAPAGTRLDLVTGIDGDVWELNAPHLPDLDVEVVDDVLVASGVTVESGITVASAQAWEVRGGEVGDVEVVTGDQSIHRRTTVTVGADGRVVLDVVMAVGSSNDWPDATADRVTATVVDMAATAIADGHDALLGEHLIEWDRVWHDSDVAIGGDPLAQVALRFGIHHNVVATPRHADHLPIGARGLSCQAYQGAAFWDQEVFNLPMFAWTEPEVARNVLRYRVRTLDGARRKAARLGYDGAYFAWISGDTGDELCPDFFFRDVLTGRWIRNHFNIWQMHISPDVALTVKSYLDITGDDSLLVDGGAELVFEVARFIASFVLRDQDGRDRLIRLLGPDEFHENVDDNAFSNHQSEAALRWALEVHARMERDHPDALQRLVEGIDLSPDEVDRWADVADRLVLPGPGEDGVIEAFDGFFDLEDVRPDDLRERLLDPDEYWGWPNGVAVHTQVSKQADVVQLFVTQPDRFDHDVMAANVDYYLPRTSHKSSLSRSAYAIVMARLGRADEALDHFVDGASVDLLAEGDAAPGGTFIGGLRTAAAGVSWAVAVLGFGGVGVDDGALVVDPHLPSPWSSLSFRVDLRGASVAVTATHDEVTVTLDEAADGPREAVVADTRRRLEPGTSTTVPLPRVAA